VCPSCAPDEKSVNNWRWRFSLSPFVLFFSFLYFIVNLFYCLLFYFYLLFNVFNRFAHSAGPELVSCVVDLFVWLFGWLVARLLACVIAFWVLVDPFYVLVNY